MHLSSVHEKESSLRREKGSQELGREVGMTGGIEEVEKVLGAVRVVVEHPARTVSDGVGREREKAGSRSTLRSDGNASFSLHLERIQHLLVLLILIQPIDSHLRRGDSPCDLEHSICQSALPVVDVSCTWDVSFPLAVAVAYSPMMAKLRIRCGGYCDRSSGGGCRRRS